MYCTNCGAEIKEGNICPNCGTSVSENKSIENTVNIDSNQTMPKNSVKTNNKKAVAVKIFMFVMAVVVIIMFFIAAHLVSDGGTGIMQIESVGGRTLEEAYYYQLGSVYAGFAMALRAMGIAAGALLFHKGMTTK